ncbi:DUF3761 domain-containing protein [Acidisoma cladoniae]|jgi:hypothetical protein|uniref:DUF3761 domain-containing protein n=1 Tax=Acidisoma cladoniae TaxID=3040935 RepID=UPI003313D4F0
MTNRFRLLPVALALALLLGPPAFAQSDTNQYYRSTDGSEVHRPTKHPDSHYGRETAICEDGTHSYSHHHRGTCSHHGGVEEWED